MPQNIPAWAVHRVSTALDAQRRAGRTSVDAAVLARRTGLSKSLVRRCLHQLRQDRAGHTSVQPAR